MTDTAQLSRFLSKAGQVSEAVQVSARVWTGPRLAVFLSGLLGPFSRCLPAQHPCCEDAAHEACTWSGRQRIKCV